jgi:hypothetical protein
MAKEERALALSLTSRLSVSDWALVPNQRLSSSDDERFGDGGHQADDQHPGGPHLAGGVA